MKGEGLNQPPSRVTKHKNGPGWIGLTGWPLLSQFNSPGYSRGFSRGNFLVFQGQYHNFYNWRNWQSQSGDKGITCDRRRQKEIESEFMKTFCECFIRILTGFFEQFARGAPSFQGIPGEFPGALSNLGFFRVTGFPVVWEHQKSRQSRLLVLKNYIIIPDTTLKSILLFQTYMHGYSTFGQ